MCIFFSVCVVKSSRKWYELVFCNLTSIKYSQRTFQYRRNVPFLLLAAEKKKGVGGGDLFKLG